MVSCAPGHAKPSGVPQRPFLHHTGRGRVIAKYLNTQHIDFTIPSLTGLGDRHYARASALDYDVSNARIWGGVHFRSAVEDGVDIAKKVTNQVLEHNFQKAKG